jgi:F-type H+-transporting ATPase subunit epsilon
MPFHVVVVSPARPLYQGEAQSLSVESLLGRIGILPRHADLVAALGTGPLRIAKAGGGEDRFAVSGGFLRVAKDGVTILVDRAARPAEIDEAAVRKELDETLAGLRHPKSDEEFTELLDRRLWCQTRLAVKH